MRRTSMCNPLQAQLLCLFKDPLEQRGRISKLGRVQAHAYEILQKLLCLQWLTLSMSVKPAGHLKHGRVQPLFQGPSDKQPTLWPCNGCSLFERKCRLCTAIRG